MVRVPLLLYFLCKGDGTAAIAGEYARGAALLCRLCNVAILIARIHYIYCSQAMNPHTQKPRILTSWVILNTVTSSPCTHPAPWSHDLSLKQHTSHLANRRRSQCGTWDAVADALCCEVMYSKAPPPTLLLTLLSYRYSGVYCRKQYAKMCRCPECGHVKHDHTCGTSDVNEAGLNQCNECLYQVAISSIIMRQHITQALFLLRDHSGRVLVKWFRPFYPIQH